MKPQIVSHQTGIIRTDAHEANYVPIAALNQYNYCPHRCWRMFCAGEFVDNQYTLEGTGLHERVHSVGAGHRQETWQVRAVWLRCDRHQLIGKSDLIEEQNGEIYPVEYKRGQPKGGQKEDFENDALQVCAQALCLEEMTGKPVSRGYVYYAQAHQRVEVKISAGLRERAIATIAAVRELLQTGKMPQPVYRPRCRGCSLYGRCLPQAAKQVAKYREID